MSGEMFLPSALDCPPLRGNCPMIPIKNHTRAFCVTSNDNQKRFVVCMASAIHIALLQNGLHMTKVWPPYIISHQVHKIFWVWLFLNDDTVYARQGVTTNQW